MRTRIRSFIEELLEAELEAALGRKRYARGRTPETEPSTEAARSPVSGHRHGHRERTLMGTFGAVTVCVPRARLATPDGGTTEWRNASLPAYQRLTRRAEALIAGAYLAGTNTRRVRRALAALFGGAIGKDVVSRVWRKVKTDWEAWTRRDLSAEPIIRLILDGTVVRCGWTARPPRSRCWWCSACGGTGRRCCWRSRTWAARARRPGGRSSTTSQPVG